MAIPGLAWGQVNTEKLRKAGDDGGFSGHIDASVAIRSGNTNLIQVGSGFRVQYTTFHAQTSTAAPKETKDVAFIVANQSYGEKAEEKFINKGFTHVRWTRMWLPWLGSEIFGQAEFNEFIRLELRALGGIGARVTAVNEKQVQLVAGTGYMLEYELLDEDATTDDPASLLHRWTSYVVLRANLWQESLRWLSTVYVQPQLEDFSDYRILADGELMVKVTDTFGLGIAANLRYDSQPPLDVEPLDISVTNKIRLSF